MASDPDYLGVRVNLKHRFSNAHSPVPPKNLPEGGTVKICRSYQRGDEFTTGRPFAGIRRPGHQGIETSIYRHGPPHADLLVTRSAQQFTQIERMFVHYTEPMSAILKICLS